MASAPAASLLLVPALIAAIAQAAQGSGLGEVGWNAHVAANQHAGPWHEQFCSSDPRAEGLRRSRDDPGVVALRGRLIEANCHPKLEVLSPSFVVVAGVLSEAQLAALRNTTEFIMRQIFAADPAGSFGGGAGKLPHRYSLGDASVTKANFHHESFCDLIDLPTTTPVLREIFGSDDYMVAGSGGDVALAGAIEYQDLHLDAIWGPHAGRVQDLRTPPVITINFFLQESTALNGPMRKIRGSHRWKQSPPDLKDEPGWMRHSTLCPVPAGAAVFRDNRCWHGGTPNLGEELRALPNLEYFAPGSMPSLGWLDRATMPLENWERLSPFARHLARGVVAMPGEHVPAATGGGHYTPSAIMDVMPFMRR